jgi:uncharacterized protein YcnI
MSISRATARRAAARLGVTLAAAGVGVVAFPLAAQAHVTIQPGQVEGGDFSVVAFRVPNERDDASTTRLRVVLPEDQPLGSVQTTATPGWQVTTKTRKLDEPIEMFGAKLDEVVSEVTWTATDAGIRPGQFEDFELSLGQLPKSGRLVFSATQTYSSGERVRWNEVSQDPATEPEHPAPTLEIAAAATEDGSGGQDAGTGPTETTADTQAASVQTEDTSTPVLPTVLSAAALVVALGAAALAFRRGRA